ncbi:TRAP transporter small permease [Aureimonas mangrovi]|uniref:TRAP transporter small permease n=1 Tax=Aureimonas mangrovi TaxID=2758041 RepID=UPI001AED52AD|nr:TRAP transporter small permease [Aureimonas mangrovi]
MNTSLVERGIDALARFCARLAGAVLLGVTAMLLADVAGRFFGHPLFGAQDVAEMSMVIITFGVVALLDRRGDQIRVDLFGPVMSARFRRVVDRLSSLLAAVIWLTLAWTQVDAAELSSLLSLSTNILGIPRAPFEYALAAFAATAGVSALASAFLPCRSQPHA